MPLSRPALLLRTSSRAVQDARVWVRAACKEIERTDLIECAEFGVSELVSNALFHGTAPVTIRMRGTVDHPRVEIRDGSTEPPLLPVPLALDDEDEVLLTDYLLKDGVITVYIRLDPSIERMQNHFTFSPSGL